ncbi:MAG: carboxylesterase family protein [Gammaproteobacteria bacterium]|nr:carboxylesterase family protein [Gammaproteobacteria bacterium]
MISKIAWGLIIVSVLVVAILLFFVLPEDNIEEIASEPDLTTLRGTEAGEVVGFIDSPTSARAWLGIPYAEPPVGDLRWRAPQPPDRSSDRIEALSPSSQCVQYASSLSAGESVSPDSIVGNEDCLYLNVWSPPNAVGLPVMLWIHGGGNSIGSGSLYNGSILAVHQKVVVVTINYRLGVLGWFHHPKLFQNTDVDSGNFGLLDIIRSLEWTRDNIDEFGGDPNNVTIFGESAGGTSVLALMASPLAEGLFHKAIVQSGSLRSTSLDSAINFTSDGGHSNSSMELVSRWFIKDGIAANRDQAAELQQSLDPVEFAQVLRRKKAAELLFAFEPGAFGMVNMAAYFRDGVVLPEDSWNASKLPNEIPAIIGSNRDEPALFMVQNPEFVRTNFWIFNSLKNKNDYLKRVYYGGLAWKARGVDSIAEQMTNAGNRNVFAYRFDWDEEPTIMFYDLSIALGAAHGLEIAFVFGHEDFVANSNIYPKDTNQETLSDQMMSYWANFAYTGDPGKGRNSQLPAWLNWKNSGKTSLVLDTPSDRGIRMIDQIITWESIREELIVDQGFNQSATKCDLYLEILNPLGLVRPEDLNVMGCTN